MPLQVRPAAGCRYDLVSLGEVMLRLDPGADRVRTARTFRVWDGGGEYNVARGLRRCFGMRTAIVTALGDNEVGRLLEDLILQGGSTPRSSPGYLEVILNDEAAVRLLIGRFPRQGDLRVCHEAGPTGFGLHRLLTSMGWPAMWSRRRRRRCPGRREIGSRPTARLARLHRALHQPRRKHLPAAPTNDTCPPDGGRPRLSAD
jgi:hypothetical protein